MFKLTCLLVCVTALASQDKEAKDFIPDWFISEMKQLTEHSGEWFTDNSKYKNKDEVFDAYLLVWSFSPDSLSLKGEMFALVDSVRVQKFWDFRMFWNAETQKVMLYQFGQAGIFGYGEMLAPDKNGVSVLIQRFFLTDGRKWETKHESYFEDSKHITESFEQSEEGQWIKNRIYSWED